jgi:hypothetical protein
MMTKEQFVNRIGLIQNFNSKQEVLSDLIDKITDGYGIVEFGDDLANEIIDMISEDMGIAEGDDLIEWWLYEDVDKIVYETKNDKEIKIEVETAEQLYDYIVENYNK